RVDSGSVVVQERGAKRRDGSEYVVRRIWRIEDLLGSLGDGEQRSIGMLDLTCRSRALIGANRVGQGQIKRVCGSLVAVAGKDVTASDSRVTDGNQGLKYIAQFASQGLASASVGQRTGPLRAKRLGAFYLGYRRFERGLSRIDFRFHLGHVFSNLIVPRHCGLESEQIRNLSRIVGHLIQMISAADL